MQVVARTPSSLTLYLDLIRWNRASGRLLLRPTMPVLWIAGDGWLGLHLVIVFGGLPVR